MNGIWLILQQLDDRYFQGLTGQYYFQLQYRLHKDGETEYIARSKPSYFMNRSTTTELDLEAGQYLVMVKITASRDKTATRPAEVVKKTCETRPEKLMAVGLSYDLAHAKGHLKEIGLERQERLRRERRDKRKFNAKKEFEAQKLVNKKWKLRRLRSEAKEKAKKAKEPIVSQDTNNGIEISVKMGESTLKSIKSQGADDSLGGAKVVSQDGTSKQLKITVEASDKAENSNGGNQITSGEIKQPAEDGDKQAEDAKQAPEENERKKEENTDTKDVSGQTSDTGTSGTTPATSAEKISTTEDKNKTESQPSAKIDENAVTGEKVPTTDATPETSGNATQPNELESNAQIQKLTLEDISDDGLSWSSDVDVPSDTSSETDTDSDSDSDEPAPPSTNSPNASANDPAKDPWNAVCVFGLRVYSKGSQAEIEVVREQDGDDSAAGSKKLDVDDQAADATKKLQKGSAREEEQLETVGAAPAWVEESRQG